MKRSSSEEYTPNVNITIESSLEAIKNLYIIILGIAITEAISSLNNFNVSFQVPSFYKGIIATLSVIPQILVVFGFLFMMYQFALGTFNILNHIAGNNHDDSARQQWSKSLFFGTACFLLTATCFYLMAVDISGTGNEKSNLFIVHLIFLLIFDSFALIIFHRPWDKLHKFKQNSHFKLWECIYWLILKSLYVLLLSITKWPAFLFYKHCYLLFLKKIDPDKIINIQGDKYITKSTHYWWISSNLWTILILIVLCFLKLHQIEYVSLLLGTVGLLNIILNHEYFFGIKSVS